MTTTPKTTVTYSLEDILVRIEDKMDARFEKIDRQFERLENKMDSQFAEVNQRLTKLEVGQAELSGDIKALDERLSGEIKTLEGKVDGLGKRLDNQEFLNRGVVVAVLAALIAGGAKLFGFLPKS
jgi:predicted nuclease with TOPRIM domain